MEEVVSLKGASSPSVLENSNVVPEMDISQVIKRARTASNRTQKKLSA